MEFGVTSWFPRTVYLSHALGYISSAGSRTSRLLRCPNACLWSVPSPRRYGIAKLDVSAVGLGIPFLRDSKLNLHSRDVTARRESVLYVKRSIEFASALGAKVVYVCSVSREPKVPRTTALTSFKESLGECADHALNAGVTLALESFPGGEVPRFESASRLVAEIGSDNPGVLLDTGHLAISGEPIDKAVIKSKRTLRHVHINNNDGLSDLHWPPYKGKLGGSDFHSFFRRLSESGYGGVASLEIASRSWTTKTIADLVEYLHGVDY